MPAIQIIELQSPNKNYILVMEDDGNLVFFDVVNKQVIWATGTNGLGAVTCFMQQDGNLVLNDKDGKTVWSTGTAGNKGASVLVRDDRNLVITNKKGDI